LLKDLQGRRLKDTFPYSIKVYPIAVIVGVSSKLVSITYFVALTKGEPMLQNLKITTSIVLSALFLLVTTHQSNASTQSQARAAAKAQAAPHQLAQLPQHMVKAICNIQFIT
jgi:hypothetical protein